MRLASAAAVLGIEERRPAPGGTAGLARVLVAMLAAPMTRPTFTCGAPAYFTTGIPFVAARRAPGPAARARAATT